MTNPVLPEPCSKKLTGRAFYKSLGSPKMILAPMVDQSEFAWRLLTRSFMAPDAAKSLLAYTPMFHARMFAETVKFRDHHFQPTRKGLASVPLVSDKSTRSGLFLDGRPDVDRPLTVQFCANDPDELLQAARYVQPYCDAVDLNLGCPQGIARKGHYGAFLQEDWDLVYRLVNKLHLHLDVPVTAKIRILETKEKTLAYAQKIISAGASILTVHGRQREQKGHRTGLADWSAIRHLRENLPPDTVIFANGNILRHEDIPKCIEATGADGVMSAEGNLYDPTIFAPPPPSGTESREYWRGRNGKGGYRVDAVFRRYMDIIHEYVLEKAPPTRKPLFQVSDAPRPEEMQAERELGDTNEEPPAKRQKQSKNEPRTSSPNLVAMQAHLFHLLRPLVSVHINVRDALAQCRAGDIAAFENVLALTENAVRSGLLDYEICPEKYEGSEEDAPTEEATTQISDHESSLAAVTACKRPWWVCQAYVRPLPKEALEKGSLTLSKKDRRQMEEEGPGDSIREKRDLADGLDTAEVPQQAMVCG